jgi:hypothetical protein
MKSIRMSIFVALVLAAVPGSALFGAPPAPPAAPRRALPSALWGVTLDNTADLRAAVLEQEAGSLEALPTKPISRIVMDVGTKPDAYAAAVDALHPVSFLMAELGDSSEMKRTTIAAYARFEQRLVTAFSERIDLFEVGNEVNGEWVGSTFDEVAKISRAYDSVTAVGDRSALTLYYNPDCWAKPANEMFTWANANISASMKAGLDDVFISYYPNDCNDYWPTPKRWQSVFDRLHSMFPNAKLGFGESGISDDHGSPAVKARLLRRYYELHVIGDNYVGGYFWWYYAEDAIPYRHNAVWRSLRKVMTR